MRNAKQMNHLKQTSKKSPSKNRRCDANRTCITLYKVNKKIYFLTYGKYLVQNNTETPPKIDEKNKER